MDFRSAAAEASLQLARQSPGTAAADLGVSVCLPIEGGRRIQQWVTIPATILAAGALLCAVVAAILGPLHLITPDMRFSLLGVGLAIALGVRIVRAWIFKFLLSSRPDSLLKAFPDLPRESTGLEDGTIHGSYRLLIDDSGVCLLDAGQQRILLEGCRYRYVIYARDVRSIDPFSKYAVSGARLGCRIAGHELQFLLTAAGQGPGAAIVQAFVPDQGANRLARALNRTLFDADIPSYRQPALPPELPATLV